ncbi:hypothetical protein ACFLS1_13015 [Verrucomicrobiota bacterium]
MNKLLTLIFLLATLSGCTSAKPKTTSLDSIGKSFENAFASISYWHVPPDQKPDNVKTVHRCIVIEPSGRCQTYYTETSGDREDITIFHTFAVWLLTGVTNTPGHTVQMLSAQDLKSITDLAEDIELLERTGPALSLGLAGSTGPWGGHIAVLNSKNSNAYLDTLFVSDHRNHQVSEETKRITPLIHALRTIADKYVKEQPQQDE